MERDYYARKTFPTRALPALMHPQRLEIPLRHRSAGAWAISHVICSLLEINIKMPDGCNVFSNATSMYTLLLVQKDFASRRLVSPVHQEPGGGRGPMIWRRPPNPIPLPELEPRFWLSPPM